MSRAVPDFAVGRGCGVKGHQSFPTSSNDEFTNALDRIQIAVWVLRSETFVVVGMTVDHQVSARVVQNLPEGLYRWSCVSTCRAVKRRMPKSHCAYGRVARQVCLKPLPLGRSGSAAPR